MVGDMPSAPINRISILGCSGGGKSTLARAIGLKLGLPAIHLDSLYWRPRWTHPSPEDFRESVAAATAGDRWVVDGNYSITFDLRLPRSDVVVVIEQPRSLCVARAVFRSLRWYGRTRPDLAESCREKFDLEFYRYVWNYQRDQAPKVRAAVAPHAQTARVVFLRSDREIDAFLREFPASA